MVISKLPAMDGIREIVKQSFVKVFDDVNHRTEVAYQRFRLTAVHKELYADYVAQSVGVFPLFGANKQAFVESAYVRVALSAQLERERYRSQQEITTALRQQRSGENSDAERQMAGKTLFEVINSTSGNVALIGNPGSGKTTILRHLALSLAKGTLVRQRRALPIFLAVRDLAVGEQSIAKGAEALLESLEITEADAVFTSLLKAGRVALLVDGIDEANREFQYEILRELEEIRKTYPKAILCVSGRPYTLGGGLPGFEKWETLPLSRSERTALVRKWFDEVDSRKGDRLLRECADNPGLLDLGSNPLLLSIVCALYYNDLKIPAEPDELYARTVEGLLGAWDAFRRIARHTLLRDLSVRRRVVLVSSVAAAMLDKSRVVFTARDVEGSGVVNRFTSSLQSGDIGADELLRALYNDFGILIERAPGLFSFSHLTLHEYLAAQYIVDNRRELELLRHHRGDEWREVIRLVAKMLPNANLYMSRLTEQTDLANDYEVTLLDAAWAMRPLCERGQTIASMRLVGDRVASALRPLRATYDLSRHRLVVRRKRSSVSDAQERSDAILHNLPRIVGMMRRTGLEFSDFQIHELPPFNVLATTDKFLGVDLQIQ